MTPRPCSDFFIASCTPNGCVYRFRLYEDGRLEVLQKISMPSPMYIQLENNKLWAILRAPFADSNESGVAAYDPCTGELLTDIFSTKGEVACHIAVDKEEIYCANYISGSIFKAPKYLDVHTGHGTDLVRQSVPHVHSVCFSPDKQYILSCDLGLDSIFVYDRNLNFVSIAKVPNGAGARHLVFSKSGNFVYCVNEMDGSISIFAYRSGTLEYLKTVSLLPADIQGAGAAIKLSANGDRLYVTERTTQKIITLKANGADLTILARTDCHGKEPRDFTLLAKERFAVCTNQFENNIALFSIAEDGIPKFLNTVDLPAPLCAIEIESSIMVEVPQSGDNPVS